MSPAAEEEGEGRQDDVANWPPEVRIKNNAIICFFYTFIQYVVRLRLFLYRNEFYNCRSVVKMIFFPTFCTFSRIPVYRFELSSSQLDIPVPLIAKLQKKVSQTHFNFISKCFF